MDFAIIQHIAHFLKNPCDIARMRATCCAWRDALAHMVPRIPRMTPQRAWKWATRRGLREFADEARDLGARNLARFGAGDARLSLDDCARMWDAKFATLDIFERPTSPCSGPRVNIVDNRAIITRDLFGTIGLVSSCTCARRDALLVGKYASEKNIYRLARIHDLPDDRGIHMIDYIILGAAKARRDQICAQLIAIRLAINENKPCRLIGFMLEAAHLDVQLPEIVVHRADIAKLMYRAASSGLCEVCEYARAICNDEFAIDAMLRGAIRARKRSIAILELARAWLEERVARSRIAPLSHEPYLMINTYISSPSGRAGMRASAFVVDREWRDTIARAFAAAAERGNRAACEYLFAWRDDMDTNTFWYVPSQRKCARITREAAVRVGAYWITDLLAARDRDFISRPIKYDEICDVPIRGRLARSRA